MPYEHESSLTVHKSLPQISLGLAHWIHNHPFVAIAVAVQRSASSVMTVGAGFGCGVRRAVSRQVHELFHDARKIRRRMTSVNVYTNAHRFVAVGSVLTFSRLPWLDVL
jgi:N6-adenosine-specific RNA methylase IME4